MRRRKLIATVGSATVISAAGCAGNAGDNSVGGSTFELSADDGDIIATFDEEQIKEFQIIGPDGSDLGGQTVSGAETRVTLFSTGRSTIGAVNHEKHIGETLEIVVFNEEGEEIDRGEFTYDPNIDVVDSSINTDENSFEITVENSSKWPVGASAIIDFDYEGDIPEIEPVDVVLVDGEDVEDLRKDSFKVVRGAYGNRYSIENDTTISGGGQSVMSLEYSRASSFDGGIGFIERFANYHELESAENIERNVSITALLVIVWPQGVSSSSNVSKNYELEITIDGFDTEIRDSDSGTPTRLHYIPRNMSIKSIKEKE